MPANPESLEHSVLVIYQKPKEETSFSRNALTLFTERELDHLCPSALEQPNATDHYVSVAYGWHSSHPLQSRVRGYPSAELVAIRLGIPDVDHITVITDSLSSAKVLSTSRIIPVRVNPLPFHSSSDPSSITTVTTKKNSGIAPVKKNALDGEIKQGMH